MLFVCLEAGSAIITLHWIYLIGPEIELNPLWRYIFAISGNWAYLGPFLVIIATISGIVLLERKAPKYFDSIGLILFFTWFFDFVNNTLWFNPAYILFRLFPSLSDISLLLLFLLVISVIVTISGILSFTIKRVVDRHILVD